MTSAHSALGTLLIVAFGLVIDEKPSMVLTASTDHGHLVVAGHAFEPPYALQATSSDLFINGISTAALGCHRFPDSTVSNAIVARYALHRTVNARVAAARWPHPSVSPSSAAVKLYASSPLVDSARASGPREVLLYWNGDLAPEIVMLSSTEGLWRRPRDPDLGLRSALAWILATLNDHGIVLMGNGYFVSVPGVRAPEAWREIEATRAYRLTEPCVECLLPSEARADIRHPVPLTDHD